MSLETDFRARAKLVMGYLRSLKSLEKMHSQPGKRFYRTAATITASRAASFIMMYNCVEFAVRETTAGIRKEIVSQKCDFHALKDYWKHEITRIHFYEKLSQGTNHIGFLEEVVAFMPGSVEWKEHMQRVPFAGNVDHERLLGFVRQIGHRWRPPPSCLGGIDLYLIRQKRNDLAHGTETFEEVGSPYRTQDMIEKFERVRTFMISYIRSVEQYCRRQKFRR
jgi:hypothetical protein